MRDLRQTVRFLGGAKLTGSQGFSLGGPFEHLGGPNFQLDFEGVQISFGNSAHPRNSHVIGATRPGEHQPPNSKCVSI